MEIIQWTVGVIIIRNIGFSINRIKIQNLMWLAIKIICWKRIKSCNNKDWTYWRRCIITEIILLFKRHKINHNGITNSPKFMTKMSNYYKPRNIPIVLKNYSFWTVEISRICLINLATTATNANAWKSELKKIYKKYNNNF
jgi:hypothetical protein